MTKDEIEKYLIKNYSTTDNREIKTVTGLTTDKLRHICKRLNLFKYDRTPVSLTGQNFKKVLIGSTTIYVLDNGTILKEDKYIYPSSLRDGKYLAISIERKRIYVHILVADAFLGNKTACQQINHKDGDKQNNSVSNLEIVSARENIQHAFATGLNHIGSKHGKSKLNESQVNSICRLIKSGVVDSEIVKRLNLQVSPQCIMQIRKGKNWKHISSKYF